MLTGTDRRCVVRSCQASAPSSPTIKYRTLVCFDINDFFDKNDQQDLVSKSRTTMSRAHKRQLDAALRSMNLLEVAKTLLLMMTETHSMTGHAGQDSAELCRSEWNFSSATLSLSVPYSRLVLRTRTRVVGVVGYVSLPQDSRRFGRTNFSSFNTPVCRPWR